MPVKMGTIRALKLRKRPDRRVDELLNDGAAYVEQARERAMREIRLDLDRRSAAGKGHHKVA